MTSCRCRRPGLSIPAPALISRNRSLAGGRSPRRDQGCCRPPQPGHRGCGYHHRRTGNRWTGTNGRPGVDVRGGVVTVATRTVADKRVWDMVGPSGSFRDGEKVGSACVLSGRWRVAVRPLRAGRPRREALPCGVDGDLHDGPRRERSALPAGIRPMIMIRRVERCLPPSIGWFPQPGSYPQNRGRVSATRSPPPPTGQRPMRSNRSGKGPSLTGCHRETLPLFDMAFLEPLPARPHAHRGIDRSSVG